MTTSYTGQELQAHVRSTWPWTVSGLVNAVGGAGLRIEGLDEVPVDLRQPSPAMDAGCGRAVAAAG